MAAEEAKPEEKPSDAKADAAVEEKKEEPEQGSEEKKIKSAEDIFGPSSGEEEEQEEEEEEEPEEDEETGPPGAPEGKLPQFNPDAEEYQTPKGREVKHEGTFIYEVGTKGNEVAVLVIGDIFGWKGGRTRVLADYIATCLNAHVAVPRFLDKPPYAEGRDDGISEDFPIRTPNLEQGLKQIKGWLMKNTYEFYLVKITTAVNFLRQKGANRIGIVGLGWGSWIACYGAEYLGAEFHAGVLVAPFLQILAQWDDVRPAKLIGKCNAPLMFMPSADEPPEYQPTGEYVQVNRQKFFRDTECEPFKDMPNGWVIKGDMTMKPRVREETIRAFFLTAKFLRKFMWPFPLGAGYGYLRLMASTGDTQTMTTLLNSGVPAGGRDSMDEVGQPPIFYAAREGFGGACKLLVEYEADVNEAGGVGMESALHVASQNNKFKAIQFLIALRADTEQKDNGGQAALHRAARVGALHAIKALVSGGAHLDARDTCEQTPVHVSCFFGNEDAVGFLLKQRADVHAEDLRGQTPRKVASKHGFEAIVQSIDKDIEKRELEEFYAEAERQAAAKEKAMEAAKEEVGMAEQLQRMQATQKHASKESRSSSRSGSRAKGGTGSQKPRKNT